MLGDYIDAAMQSVLGPGNKPPYLAPQETNMSNTFMGYTAEQIKEMAAFWKKWQGVMEVAPKELEKLAARKELEDAERAMAEAGKRAKKAREDLASLDGIMLCDYQTVAGSANVRDMAPGARAWNFPTVLNNRTDGK